jgi:hypothetical protein
MLVDKTLAEESKQDSVGRAGVRILGMRTGTSIHVTASDRARLLAVVGDRNSSQKHVRRARIELLTADGHGTSEIMR